MLASFQKVGPIELILIPGRIQTRCILNARSDIAKQRLVLAAMLAAYEDMKRIHVPAYKYPRDDKKHNYKEKSTWQFVKEFFIKENK